MDKYENLEVLQTATRPPVCGHCRRMKVKCEPEPHDELGRCQRCLKASRNCVPHLDTQEQPGLQRNSDIIRLEEKIDALASALKPATSCSKQESLSKLIQRTSRESTYGEDVVRQPLIGKNSSLKRFKRARLANENELETSQTAEALTQDRALEICSILPQPWKLNLGETLCPTLFDFTKDSSSTTPPERKNKSQQTQAHQCIDVVGQGKLSVQMASLIFGHYVENMAPHLPAVVFPLGLDVQRLRQTKPVLFLAILTVGSGALYPDLHESLNKMTLEVLVDRVINHGEKSLEIVQALIVYSIWYPPPPKVDQLTFQQLLAIAATVVDHIVRTKFTLPSASRLGGSERNSEDEDWSLQFRRAWLGCFIVCSKSSILWQEPSFIHWSCFGPACIVALEMVEDPLESDFLLCKTAQYQYIAEIITGQRAISDRVADLSMKNGQVLLDSLENKLSNSDHMKGNYAPASLMMYREATNMFTFEPIIHNSYGLTLFRAPYAIEKLHRLELRRVLSDEEFTDLYACVTSAQRWIDFFLSLDVLIVRSLPGFCFADAAYAVIILVAAAFIVDASHSLGRFAFLQNLQLDSNVRQIENAFSTAAKDHKCLSASRFCPIFSKIREKIQDQFACPITSISEQYQSKPIRDSSDIRFENRYSWLEISNSTATGENLEDFRNFSHFPVTGGFGQNDSPLEYFPIGNEVILSRDTSGNLSYDSEMGMIGRVESCEKSNRHMRSGREAPIWAETALSMQAAWDVPADFF